MYVNYVVQSTMLVAKAVEMVAKAVEMVAKAPIILSNHYCCMPKQQLLGP